MTINDNGAATITPETGQPYLTWIFFDNAGYYAPTPPGYSFFNTEANSPKQDGPVFTLKMTFKTPPARATLGAAPFNPFLFSTADRSIEVHLPDYPPTKLANTALFGTGDDTSKSATKRYYKTAKNLPWALHIGEGWHHPLEKTMITVAYPKFGQWAEAGGKSSLDWYLLPNVSPVGIYP
jgi:LruC domain-containing protein